MDLLFLGTSAGAPTKARNVSATALLEDELFKGVWVEVERRK